VTVLGAYLPDHDHAVLWADSEVFRWDGTATGRHVRKMAVNSVAGVLGAGAGWGDIAGAGDQIVHRAKSLDDAVHLLPGALRQASTQSLNLAWPRPETFVNCCYIAVGWSAASCRTLVWRFDAASFFVPIVAAMTLAPMVDAPRAPSCEGGVLELAERQMQLLQDEAGQAGAGHLTIATLSPNGIALRLHRDFFTPKATADVLPLQLAEAAE
jgi:hypothetical protein